MTHDRHRAASHGLESRIYRFAFQCQHSEDTLVDSSQRFVTDEAFQTFDTESEFTQGE